MNYVQLHLGDWIAGTLDLTPTERGVYMDLLVRYYKEERPLMQDECKRIARGYAPAEQEAMHYVLQRFFTLENGEYRQSRCDEEIEKAQAVSNKRKRAAASRWAKKPDFDASAYPNAEQTHSECNADGMLTNNHYPLTINHKEGGKPARANGVTRVPLYPFPEALPPDWANDAVNLRPDVIPETVFQKLKNRYSGPVCQKKAMHMWKREFLNWVSGEWDHRPKSGNGETEEEKQRSIENIERMSAEMERRMAELGR